jgi:hypothetical protein
MATLPGTQRTPDAAPTQACIYIPPPPPGWTARKDKAPLKKAIMIPPPPRMTYMLYWSGEDAKKFSQRLLIETVSKLPRGSPISA